MVVEEVDRPEDEDDDRREETDILYAVSMMCKCKFREMERLRSSPNEDPNGAQVSQRVKSAGLDN